MHDTDRKQLESYFRCRAEGGVVPVVLTTHETKEAAMRRALELIAALDSVAEPPCMIRIENS